MKKTSGLIALLLAVMFTAGCGKSEAGSSSSASVSGSGSDISLSVSQSASANASGSGSGASGSGSGAASAVSSQAPAPVPMQGSFINLDENRYPNERAPLLELNTDGTFSLRLNIGDGLAAITGTYQRLGTALTLTILQQDTHDYLGADITTLTFSALSEDHLSYTGEPLGMARAKDQFTRDGIPPMSEPEPVVASAPASAISGEAAAASVTAASGAASVVASK